MKSEILSDTSSCNKLQRTSRNNKLLTVDNSDKSFVLIFNKIVRNTFEAISYSRFIYNLPNEQIVIYTGKPFNKSKYEYIFKYDLKKLNDICLTRDLSNYTKVQLDRVNLSDCILMKKDLSLRTVNMVPFSSCLYQKYIYINDVEGLVHRLDFEDLSISTLGYYTHSKNKVISVIKSGIYFNGPHSKYSYNYHNILKFNQYKNSFLGKSTLLKQTQADKSTEDIDTNYIYLYNFWKWMPYGQFTHPYPTVKKKWKLNFPARFNHLFKYVKNDIFLIGFGVTLDCSRSLNDLYQYNTRTKSLIEIQFHVAIPKDFMITQPNMALDSHDLIYIYGGSVPDPITSIDYGLKIVLKINYSQRELSLLSPKNYLNPLTNNIKNYDIKLPLDRQIKIVFLRSFMDPIYSCFNQYLVYLNENLYKILPGDESYCYKIENMSQKYVEVDRPLTRAMSKSEKAKTSSKVFHRRQYDPDKESPRYLPSQMSYFSFDHDSPNLDKKISLNYESPNRNINKIQYYKSNSIFSDSGDKNTYHNNNNILKELNTYDLQLQLSMPYSSTYSLHSATNNKQRMNNTLTTLGYKTISISTHKFLRAPYNNECTMNHPSCKNYCSDNYIVSKNHKDLYKHNIGVNNNFQWEYCSGWLLSLQSKLNLLKRNTSINTRYKQVRKYIKENKTKMEDIEYIILVEKQPKYKLFKVGWDLQDEDYVVCKGIDTVKHLAHEVMEDIQVKFKLYYENNVVIADSVLM